MKILKIEHCSKCEYFNYLPVNDSFPYHSKISRFKCYNLESVRGNGNYRIINRKLALKGEIPNWCKLEDYKNDI